MFFLHGETADAILGRTLVGEVVQQLEGTLWWLVRARRTQHANAARQQQHAIAVTTVA